MSDATLRAGIKTILSTVAGAGKIHDYERWIIDQDRFISQFKDISGRIMGWEITRVAIPRVDRIGSNYKVYNDYRLKGYYGLKDDSATEKAFQSIVDAVIQKFLFSKISGSQGHAVPKADTIGVRVFGQVLCHYAEIALIDVAEIICPPVDGDITDLLSVQLDYYLTEPVDNVIDMADTVDLPDQPKG